jgi:hypothetical protein
MSVIPTVYSSLRDLVGVMFHPLVGSFTFAGELGVGSISFEKSTTRSTLDVAGDGAVMISALPGGNGIVHLEIQQVSSLQGYLQTWANALYAAQRLGDVSLWASATMTFTSVVDQSTHVAYGVSPTKEPTKVYGSQGARLSWELLAADLVSLTAATLNL